MKNNIGEVKTEEFTLSKFVAQGYRFSIPIYQRLYVWKEAQVKTLLEDLGAAYLKTKDNSLSEEAYFLGAIMLLQQKDSDNNKIDIFDLIDGQQRFTTLWLISKVLGNEDFIYFNFDIKPVPRLQFAIRDFANRYFENNDLSFNKQESEQLKQIFEAKKIIESFVGVNDEDSTENSGDVSDVFKEIRRDRAGFKEYIYTRVNFLSTEMPTDTDVNKLFEVLNNRGVQLQQHEILKAYLLRIIKDDKERCERYALIWDACAEMEGYIESNFKQIANVKWRDITKLSVSTSEKEIDGISDKLEDVLKLISRREEDEELSLFNILKSDFSEEEVDDDDTEDYSNKMIRSVISFPMFLLHSLRVFAYTKSLGDKSPAVDEKKLVAHFKAYFGNAPKKEDVIDFFDLMWTLRVRFDNLIVKWVKDFETKEESLLVEKLYYNKKSHSLYRRKRESEESDAMELLQAMLYHSQQITTQYWLTPLFNQILKNKEKKYLYKYLKMLDNLMFLSENKDNLNLSERSLKLCDEIEFQKNQLPEIIPYVENFLRTPRGTSFPSYWFYKMDFILWHQYVNGKGDVFFNSLSSRSGRDKEKEWRSFSITARNSVEHICPQNPKDEERNLLLDDGVLKRECLDDFGNLVLLTSSINSEYSNKIYTTKQSEFNAKNRLDSLKSHLIFSNDKWNWKRCSNHRDLMINVFKQYLQDCDESYRTNKLDENDVKKLIHDNENILVRAMLCLEDISKQKGHHGWSVKNKNHYLKSDAFRKVREWIELNVNSNLEDFIELELQNNEELNEIDNQWRYLFAKYHEIIDFSSYGMFKWNNDDQAGLVITSLTRIQESYFNRKLPLFLFYILWRRESEYLINIDEQNLYIEIEYDGKLVPKGTRAHQDCFTLTIWLEEDTFNWCYQLYSPLHGNSRIIKKLLENGWDYATPKALYYRELPLFVEHKKGRKVESEVETARKKVKKILKLLQRSLQ